MKGIPMPRLEAFARALLLASIALAGPVVANAQFQDENSGAIEVTEPPAASTSQPSQPRVGRKAAEKYMGQRGRATSSGGGGAHYLALHGGTFVSDNAYLWGLPDNQSNTGRWNVGVTYRVGEWVNSMDLGLRVDLQSFALAEGGAKKLSFLPIITFPDASSRFPLYFGAGIGPGVFINQIAQESSISVDYQLFAGVRFFDILGSTGFFVEAGLKNHFLLFSSGQFNGTFVAGGAVFTF
jgi:hypothetical protein